MQSRPFSIISDEVSQDLNEVAQFVRDFQLSGFELRSLFGRAFKDLTSADVAAVKALAQGEGWRIHGCSTPVFKCELNDESATRAHEEIFKRSLEVALDLDCRLLRVFTFLRQPEVLSAEVLERISLHLRPLADLAAKAGVKLGIENESSCRIGSGPELKLLGKHLTHPAVGWIWDPCNALYVPGFRANGTGGDPCEGFDEILPRILHIHVKDAVLTPGASSPAAAVPVGDGDVNWSQHMRAIRQSSYQGLLSLETHWRKQALDEKLLHLPAGHAFSAGGEEASRICIRRLELLWNASN